MKCNKCKKNALLVDNIIFCQVPIVLLVFVNETAEKEDQKDFKYAEKISLFEDLSSKEKKEYKYSL